MMFIIIRDYYLTLCSCVFFSSRGRHTRFSRDGSSDVCSSDLDAGGRAARCGHRRVGTGKRGDRWTTSGQSAGRCGVAEEAPATESLVVLAIWVRRVVHLPSRGRECDGYAPHHKFAEREFPGRNE